MEAETATISNFGHGLRTGFGTRLRARACFEAWPGCGCSVDKCMGDYRWCVCLSLTALIAQTLRILTGVDSDAPRVGTDSGVINLVGEALRDFGEGDARPPCIGIAPWRKLMYRERFTDARDVTYLPRKANSEKSVAIDSSHTHFIMVDDGNDEYGGEIPLRGGLEREISRHFRVPTVLLVVQGGPGSYSTVRKGIENGQRVLLVKESHGAAQIIAEYCEPLMKEKAVLMSMSKNELEEHLLRRDKEFKIHTRKLGSVGRKLNKLDDERVDKIIKDLHQIATRLDLLSGVQQPGTLIMG